MKNKLKHMTLRIGNLEIRTCNQSLLQKGKHVTAEIVKWKPPDFKMCWKEYNFTIAYWKLGKEGFDLEFIGARPFEYAPPKEFWKLAKLGNDYLQEYFINRREEKIEPLIIGIEIKERTINIHDAIKYIKEIQNGSFDRYDILDEIPLGEIAKAKWNDSMFSYGMEYGAIYALMKLFNMRKEEL